MDTWNQIAQQYHRFVDSPADKLRTELLYPTLWHVMSPLANKKILDVGCGNGFFAYHTAQKGTTVDAFDNAGMVSIAKHYFSHTHVHYQVHDANQPFPYQKRQYDVVIANLVLMDMPHIESLLRESKRVLGDQGQIIISILHPCFTPPVGTFRRGIRGRLDKKHAYFHLNNYFGAPLESSKQSFGNNVPATTYYHRTISDYAHCFRRQDLMIVDIFEPRPDPIFIKKYPQFFHAEKISIFSIFILQPKSTS